MWAQLSKIILKNRVLLILSFVVLTAFMGWKATHIKLSYAGSKILPLTDSVFIKYNAFKKLFGEDGNVVVIGIASDKIFQKDTYNNWAKLSNDLQKLNGIKGVLSIGKFFELQKDTINQNIS